MIQNGIRAWLAGILLALGPNCVCADDIEKEPQEVKEAQAAQPADPQPEFIRAVPSPASPDARPRVAEPTNEDHAKKPGHPVESVAEAECSVGELHFETELHLGNGIRPRIEYLLWRARRRALDFAIVDPNNDGVPQGVVQSLFYDTDNGVRAGAALRLPDPHWELNGTYTYFHAHNNRFLSSPPGGTVYVTVSSPSTVREVTGIFGQANVDLDVADLDIGPRLCVGESFKIRFFGGARAAWIDQRFNVFGTGGDAGLIDENFNFGGYRLLDEIRMSGFGLRVGSEGHWLLHEGITLFARGAMAILAADFEERRNETTNGGLTLIADTQERYEQIVPVLEVAVGFTYQLSEDRRLAVGYELSNWFNMVDSVDFVDDVAVGKASRRRSDLTFGGLFVQLSVDF